jgi:hypothetical protein
VQRQVHDVLEVDGFPPGPAGQASGDRHGQRRPCPEPQTVQFPGPVTKQRGDLHGGNAERPGDEAVVDQWPTGDCPAVLGCYRLVPVGESLGLGTDEHGKCLASVAQVLQVGEDVGASSSPRRSWDATVQPAGFPPGGQDVGGEVGDRPQRPDQQRGHHRWVDRDGGVLPPGAGVGRLTEEVLGTGAGVVPRWHGDPVLGRQERSVGPQPADGEHLGGERSPGQAAFVKCLRVLPDEVAVHLAQAGNLMSGQPPGKVLPGRKSARQAPR